MALLTRRLVPMEDLLKAACDGDLNKKCWGCYKHFLVQCVKFWQIPKKSESDGVVMFRNLMTPFYLCGKCDKRKEGFERYARLILKAFH